MTGLRISATRTLGIAVGLTGLLGGAGAVLDRAPALALINESPSLPRGLYLRIPGRADVRGATVAVPQPAAARDYLGGLGMPRDVLLIKRVAAVGGNRVCRRNNLLELPDGTIRVLSRDRKGQALPQWSGCRTLAPDEVFLIGDTGSSFDSRYFGPVRKGEIEGVYKEMVRW